MSIEPIRLQAQLEELNTQLAADESDYEYQLQLYQKQQEVLEALAQADPGQYLPQLAHALQELGWLHSIFQDYRKASDCYWKALSIREQLAAVSPDDCAAELLDLCIHFYESCDKEEDAAWQESFFRKSLALLENKPLSQQAILDTAHIHAMFGMFYNKLSQPQQAIAYFRKALDILEQQEAAAPGCCSVLLSAVCRSLGDLQKAQGNISQALVYFRKELHVIEQQEAANPSSFLFELLFSLIQLGDLCSALRSQEAEGFYLRALECCEKLSPNLPNSSTSLQATIYRSLSEYCLAAGNPSQAALWSAKAQSLQKQ